MVLEPSQHPWRLCLLTHRALLTFHQHLPQYPFTPRQVRRDLETRPEVVNLQDEQYIRKTADRMQDVVRWLHVVAAVVVPGWLWLTGPAMHPQDSSRMQDVVLGHLPCASAVVAGWLWLGARAAEGRDEGAANSTQNLCQGEALPWGPIAPHFWWFCNSYTKAHGTLAAFLL